MIIFKSFIVRLVDDYSLTSRNFIINASSHTKTSTTSTMNTFNFFIYCLHNEVSNIKSMSILLLCIHLIQKLKNEMITRIMKKKRKRNQMKKKKNETQQWKQLFFNIAIHWICEQFILFFSSPLPYPLFLMIITLAQKFTPKMQWWESRQQKCKTPPKYRLYIITLPFLFMQERICFDGAQTHINLTSVNTSH